MSNEPTDQKRSLEGSSELHGDLQQQFNFSNANISAEKIVFGFGDNVKEYPFGMNKDEFEKLSNKTSVSTKTGETSAPAIPQANTQHTWKALRNHIIDRPYTAFNANYAGYDIKCTGNGYIRKFKLVWCCKCTDISTGESTKCDRYKSQHGACEHTLAELVRKMHGKNIYPLPTDADSMTTGCQM